jgi:hypothetical protein
MQLSLVDTSETRHVSCDRKETQRVLTFVLYLLTVLLREWHLTRILET